MSYGNRVKSLSKVLKPVFKEEEADAAVALLLKPTDQVLKVFLVKRVENPSDPWSGQMSLPGGKRDAEDQNLKQTVVRETLEETNINLLYRCRFLGLMKPMRSTLRPEMKILPFVVLLEHEPLIRLNEELKWFVWISLEELIQNESTVKFDFGEFPAYLVGNSVVWGLTHRILKKFVKSLGYSH